MNENLVDLLRDFARPGVELEDRTWVHAKSGAHVGGIGISPNALHALRRRGLVELYRVDERRHNVMNRKPYYVSCYRITKKGLVVLPDAEATILGRRRKASMRNRVTNTTDEMNNNPLASLLFLAEGMGPGGPSAAILRQEADGQKELVRSQSLPTECRGEAALTIFGVELGEPFPNDKLFRPAKLPPGWKVVPTSHSMGSDLVDEKGRKRASIFYKAAFYDRKAHMNVLRRYNVEDEYCDADGKPIHGMAEQVRAVVKDVDTVLFATAFLANPPNGASDGDRRLYFDRWEAMREEAAAWLTERFPLWQDPAAYWD